MKPIYIIATVLLGFVESALATPKNFTDSSVIVCPDVNQLQVEIMKGTATAPDGWSGQSAIPLADQTNWQSTVVDINAQDYGTSGSYHQGKCEYITQRGAEIVAIKRSIPSDYQLYDANHAAQPMSSCWTQQSQVNAGENKNCYWYSNPVLKK